MVEKPNRLDRELVYRGSILDIYKDTMQFANGTTEEWDFVAHRMGAACVLPDGRLLLVRQYRNALDRETIEVPAGCRDSLTEDTRITAKRELEEETGYTCGRLDFMMSLRTTVAFCNEHVDVYLARDLTDLGTQHLDDAESIEVEAFDYDDLCGMIREGVMEDSKTIAAIMTYGAIYRNA